MSRRRYQRFSRVDLWRIAADALVHPTSESMKPRSDMAERLFQIGGVRTRRRSVGLVKQLQPPLVDCMHGSFLTL
jgi:hypothetical protein